MKTMIQCLLVILAVAGTIAINTAQAQENEKKVGIDQVPASVRKAIKKTVADGKLIDIGEITANGKKTYEIEMHRDGQEIDVTFDANGKVIGKSLEGKVSEQRQNNSDDERASPKKMKSREEREEEEGDEGDEHEKADRDDEHSQKKMKGREEREEEEGDEGDEHEKADQDSEHSQKKMKDREESEEEEGDEATKRPTVTTSTLKRK